MKHEIEEFIKYLEKNGVWNLDEKSVQYNLILNDRFKTFRKYGTLDWTIKEKVKKEAEKNSFF